MTEPLRRLLSAEDLDDLVLARAQLGDPGPEDLETIRDTLELWVDRQGVANLLFHPDLIPSDIRVRQVLKGLGDRANPYNALAASVGLQRIPANEVSIEERALLRKRLLDTLVNGEDIVAARASVSIWPFLTEQDTGAMFGALACTRGTARHNVLCWLYNTIQPDSGKDFVALAAQHGLSPEAQVEIQKAIDEDVARVALGNSTKIGLGPLLAYVPNLRDTVRS